MKKQIRLDGLEVFYREKGKGEPILLLHGWGKSGKAFFSLQKLLAADFKTLVLDLPAFGQSSPPFEAWGIKDYARFVKRLSQKIGWEEFSLIGHSFGGRIAIELAVLYPQRVKKLILTGVPILRKKKSKRLFFWTIAKVANLFFMLPPFFLFKAYFRRIFYFLIGERDYYQAKGIKREILKKAISYPQEKSLEKVKTPTLIVWGENDQLTPLDHGQRLHQKINNSRLEIIPKASHKLPYEKPEEFMRKIISILKS